MGAEIDLSGKGAVVTGGSRGVGRATAVLLARAGADVGIGYHRREDEARETVDEIRTHGVHGWAQRGDLSRPEEAEALFERAEEELDRLDLFVGNAGIWPSEEVPMETMEEARWRRTLSVNLDSIFYTVRAALRRMEEGGRIVLVTSTAAQRGEAYHGDYAASKGAIQSLVKGLCVETAERKITVNAVAPGWIDTEMSETAYADGGRERIEASIPLGRVAAPDDVAGPVLFLCSSFGRHLTGEVLNVNGGAVLAG